MVIVAVTIKVAEAPNLNHIKPAMELANIVQIL